MEVIYKQGDVLEAEERWIINPIGVEYFWSSTSKEIFNKYPSAYSAYVASKEFGGMRQGIVTFAEQPDHTFVFNTIFQLEGQIVDFEAVIECAQVINKYCKAYNITQIAIQAESISKGFYNTEVTLEIFEAYLEDVQLTVYRGA